MRRIVAFNRVSADGYFAGTDGNLNWVVPDPEIDRGAAESIDSGGPGTLLFGRRTYEQFESFWPHALDDAKTAADPHRPGARSPELRAMAVWINEATKIVFSKARKDVTWKNSRLVRDVVPKDIEALKNEPGGNMMIFGSGAITSQLTQHGLIDEYQFVVGPLLLGSGRLLIRDVPKSTRLELLEVKKFPSGNVMMRYGRPR
jgi:dihydrofolate reductase